MVFVPHRTPRETALAEIASELSALQTRINRRGIKAEIASSKTGDETKLLARRDRIEVKIEINRVFRGTLLPVETRSLTKTASDLFTTALAVPTLAVAELYGSKLVAAMDRQHPRDLFDVHGMFNRFGLTPEIVECFVGYIAGHNRPVHEVLGSRDIDYWWKLHQGKPDEGEPTKEKLPAANRRERKPGPHKRPAARKE